MEDDNGALSPSMQTPLCTLKTDNNDDESSEHRQLAVVNHTASRFSLPDHWCVRTVESRKCYGRIDKYYYEPKSGVEFRSLKAVERYLTGEEDAPRPKALKLGNAVKKLKLDEKKSSQLQLAVLDPTIAAATSHFKLPDGWIVEGVRRRSDPDQSNPNQLDKYYYEPGTGRKFRSLTSVAKHIKKMKEEEMKEDVPLSQAFKLGNILKKKKHNSKQKKKHNSKQKKARQTCSTASDSKNNDPPEKVKWVLGGTGGGGGDTWSPFIGESTVPDSMKQQWAEKFTESIGNEHHQKNENSPLCYKPDPETVF